MAMLEANEPINKKQSRRDRKRARKAAIRAAGVGTSGGTAAPTPGPERSRVVDEAAQTAPPNSSPLKGPRPRDEGLLSGIQRTFKRDVVSARKLGRNVDRAMNVDKQAASMAEQGVELSKISDYKKANTLQNAGSQFLGDIGGGSKVVGGAKIGGYLLGTSMLVDLLNPFDED